MEEQVKKREVDPAQELYSKSKAAKEIQKDVDPYAMWSFILPFCIFPVAFFPFLNIMAFFLFPVISIILGIVGIVKINSEKKTKGKGFAIAGIVLSSLWILLIVVGVIFIMNYPPTIGMIDQ